MNPKIPIIVGMAGALTGIGTAIANANGWFTGHPYLAYWFYGAALLLILTAFFLARKPHIPSTSDVIKTSFNPVNTLTANPTIIVNPGREHEVAKPVPVISPRPSPVEPNLRLGRVWRETLFRMRDDFFFRSRIDSALLPSYATFHCIVAEIRNTAGHARNIKAELAVEGGIIGPLTWAEKESNTISLEIGDSAYILLAAYLYAPLTKTSEWRVPVNKRRRGELPGATLIELTQWTQQNEGFVKLNILHPDSGTIIKTFNGAYQWPGGELEPKFTFAEQETRG
jgi:hypothetical protein